MSNRWSILALLFLSRIGLGYQFQTLGSVGDDLIAAFGLDYAEIGTLVGMFMVPGMFLAIPAGFCGRYFSDRTLSGLGLVALALGGLVSGLAPDTWLIALGRALSGAGFLLSTLYFTKMTADWFSGKEIATAMSILVMSWPFGIAMGQIGHEWLAEAAGWRAPFFAASIYCTFGALAIFALYKPPLAHESDAHKVTSGLSRRELHLILAAGVAWGFFNAAYVIYLNFGPLIVEADGHGAVEAAAIISIGSWIMIFSGAACGQISDRTGRPDLVLTICMLGAMGSLALLSVGGSGIFASLLFGLIGAAPAGIIMAMAGEAMRPEQRALGMGVFFTIYYLIMAVVPPLAGWIHDVSSRPFNAILLGIVLMGLVIVANTWFRLAKRTGSPSV